MAKKLISVLVVLIAVALLFTSVGAAATYNCSKNVYIINSSEIVAKKE